MISDPLLCYRRKLLPGVWRLTVENEFIIVRHEARNLGKRKWAINGHIYPSLGKCAAYVLNQHRSLSNGPEWIRPCSEVGRAHVAQVNLYKMKRNKS